VRKINLQICLVFLASVGIVNPVGAEETNHLNRVDDLIVEGAIHYDHGEFDKAISNLTTVLQFDPTNAIAIFDRAIVYRAEGEFVKSIEDLNKYILLNPTDDSELKVYKRLFLEQRVLAFEDRASDFAAIGEYDKAIDDWSESLRLNADEATNATSLAMRGFCYYKKGRFGEAEKDYHQAIQIDPKNPSAWNNLGWLRATCPIASMRNGKEAVEAATKACNFSSWTNWTRLDTLAAAFAETDDFQQAIKYQKQALDMTAAGDKERKAMQDRLALYEQQLPYRETQKP
jgi:tetratricopeptide (TPR) repeat protein